MCALESSLLRSLGRLAGCFLLLLLLLFATKAAAETDFVAGSELGVGILLDFLVPDESFEGVSGSVGEAEESGWSVQTSV